MCAQYLIMSIILLSNMNRTQGTYKLCYPQVTVIDANHKVLYDTLVKPHNPVIDYVTQVGK